MPEIEELARHFRGNDNFAILTVSLDGRSTAGQLRQTIADHGISWPVLHVGAEDGWNDGNFDWQIEAVPTPFIITPEGTVLGSFWADPLLPGMLEQLMDEPGPVPTYGLEVSQVRNEDGSFRAAVKVTSPDHQPVRVDFTARKVLKEYWEQVGGEFVKIEPIPEGKEWNCSGNYDIEGFESVPLEFTFGEFGENTQYIDVPPVTEDNCSGVSFTAVLTVQVAHDLDGPGEYSLWESSSYWVE